MGRRVDGGISCGRSCGSGRGGRARVVVKKRRRRIRERKKEDREIKENGGSIIVRW